MKLNIELDDTLAADALRVTAHPDNAALSHITKLLTALKSDPQLTFLREERAYFFPVGDVLFFETQRDAVVAHTTREIYAVKETLAKLEDILPHTFLRVSKSAIANTAHIFSISRNLTATSLIEFANTHKQIYVSRRYYRQLHDLLEQRGHIL